MYIGELMTMTFSFRRQQFLFGFTSPLILQMFTFASHAKAKLLDSVLIHFSICKASTSSLGQTNAHCICMTVHAWIHLIHRLTLILL
ncbi:hypothetical protein XELAEV_18030685mg [Xenopus laevis]|uniref:Uncharacterized protein n=1 Tax=Xenopus laevis TaxID=8355 RepID=A0A974CL78_XENLA|nr:hypothetical protein XELAEV_18030685mg [Xenopus laevis]